MKNNNLSTIIEILKKDYHLLCRSADETPIFLSICIETSEHHILLQNIVEILLGSKKILSQSRRNKSPIDNCNLFTTPLDSCFCLPKHARQTIFFEAVLDLMMLSLCLTTSACKEFRILSMLSLLFQSLLLVFGAIDCLYAPHLQPSCIGSRKYVNTSNKYNLT